MAGNKMGEQTRDKILLAAQQEFLENGFEKAKVEDIARRAGVTKVMLYYHFNTKQNIFNEIVKKTIGEIKREFRESMSRLNMNAPADFRNHLGTMLDFYQNHQSMLRLILSQYLSNQNQENEDLGIFNELFEIIFEMAGISPAQARQPEFLTRLFFFNGLPMVLYPCLAEKFYKDFALDPEKGRDIFIDKFAASFFESVSAGKSANDLYLTKHQA